MLGKVITFPSKVAVLFWSRKRPIQILFLASYNFMAVGQKNIIDIQAKEMLGHAEKRTWYEF